MSRLIRVFQTKPEEISLSARKISVLAPKSGPKEISPMQGDLKLEVEKEIGRLWRCFGRLTSRRRNDIGPRQNGKRFSVTGLDPRSSTLQVVAVGKSNI